MCFGHIWVQLGHVTMVRVMCIQDPKWPPAKLQVFKFYVTNIHNYCWNLSQILLEYAISLSNRGLYIHYSRWEGIKVSTNLDFNTSNG